MKCDEEEKVGVVSKNKIEKMFSQWILHDSKYLKERKGQGNEGNAEIKISFGLFLLISQPWTYVVLVILLWFI